MTKNVWIDLTDIEQWSGHHGGTQRVVYGIAKGYYQKKNARFFTYSPLQDAFYETSFEPILLRVEGLKTQPGAVMATESFESRLKKKMLRYAPSYIKNNKRLKKNLKGIAKSAIGNSRRLVHVGRRYVNPIRQLVKGSQQKGQPIIFGDQDIVLILGKPWDNPGLQKLLIRQKRTTDFKVVQVVYDLIISLYPHLHHPTLFKTYTQHMFDAVAVSDLMLPISESSNRDLKVFCDKLNLEMPKTEVIRLGDEIEVKIAETMQEKPDARIDDKFILCVGTIENRKNHTLLYQTYKLAAERGITLPQLVIAGGRGWLADDIQYLISHDPAVAEKIVIMYSPSDATLSWLYKNCQFTVYPSLYEGWGLPVAESLALGKVCVSSKISSMPEIAGDMLTYFSPNSTDECLDAIVHMTDPAVLSKAESRIRTYYKTTAWNDTYKQTDEYVSSL